MCFMNIVFGFLYHCVFLSFDLGAGVGRPVLELRHRVVSYREFIWTPKNCTQLFDMKFHPGGNEC